MVFASCHLCPAGAGLLPTGMLPTDGGHSGASYGATSAGLAESDGAARLLLRSLRVRSLSAQLIRIEPWLRSYQARSSRSHRARDRRATQSVMRALITEPTNQAREVGEPAAQNTLPGGNNAARLNQLSFQSQKVSIGKPIVNPKTRLLAWRPCEKAQNPRAK